MWETSSIWFEIAVISSLVALGHIAFSRFEEQTSRARKLIKFVVVLLLGVTISQVFGRAAFAIFILLFLLLVAYLHIIYLPMKGINGWTGEPKKKYYQIRGWSIDIFNDTKKEEA